MSVQKGFRSFIYLSFFVLVGCVSGLGQWPEQLPAQRYFVSSYEQDSENKALQSQEDYLTWIVRFYLGWELMPTGWHDLRENMLFGLEGSDYVEMEQDLGALGAKISAEWAKDNSVRKIDSAMLSLWGSVIQADFAVDARMSSVELIMQDVNAVLVGATPPSAINEERYARLLELSLNPGIDTGYSCANEIA